MNNQTNKKENDKKTEELWEFAPIRDIVGHSNINTIARVYFHANEEIVAKIEQDIDTSVPRAIED